MISSAALMPWPESAKREAEVLVGHALGLSRVQLVTQGERPLTEDEEHRARELLKRRARHEPVAYIVGRREFWSLSFKVDRRVLVPRPETECLVEQCLRRFGGARRILEIGTGSGAIVAALASEWPDAAFVATDASAEALEVARENLEALGFLSRVELRQGLNYAPISDGEVFDLIVSNPPYIAERARSTLMPDVVGHEPSVALFGGLDGLGVLAALIEGAQPFLEPQGGLSVEMGCEQGEQVLARFEAAGFGAAEISKDYAGLDRVVAGRRGSLRASNSTR